MCRMLAMVLVGLALAPTEARAQAAPSRVVVAVMDIEFVGLKQSPANVERLTVLLTGRLGATGRFQVIPREQVKKRLVELKLQSYSAGCDTSCQIELGHAVAASKTITTQVVKAGSRCAVTMNVFDLGRETSEGGASMDGGCTEDAIVESLRVGVAQLAGGGTVGTGDGSGATPVPGSPATPPPPVVVPGGPQVTTGRPRAAVGDLTVAGQPADRVRLEVTGPDGRTVASGSPYKNPAAAVGTWKVTASATGYETETRTIQVPADDVVFEKLELKALGALTVAGKPEGAKVVVTGPGFSNEGWLPWSASGLTSGTYRVQVTRETYVAHDATVEVRPGETARVSVDLPRQGTAGAGWVRIPAGEFRMGSPDGEPGRGSDEGPVHTVRITRPFLMQATEVTQGQWRALMGNNPSNFKNCGDECPVESVSWWDALAYANALSRKEGLPECYRLTGCSGRPGDGSYQCGDAGFQGLSCRGYRLPTEAEWEYAARAGTTTALYTGPLTIRGANNGPELDGIAWYGGNSGVSYSGGYDCSGWSEKQYSSSTCGTHPVGKKKPNGWGLYDMLGNVWEWTWDWYGAYSAGTATDPTGPSTGAYRVVRGGSCFNFARLVRAANRGRGRPGRPQRLPRFSSFEVFTLTLGT